jgi:RNA polymerase sigma factor (sigma-70 family)
MAYLPPLQDTFSDIRSETFWTDFYPLLRSRARKYVYAFKVPSWQGQEEDITEDIVQETVRRFIERAEKAEQGQQVSIRSIEAMMITIACNYCKDLRRHDSRLVRIDSSTCSERFEDDQEFLDETATEHVYQESIFLQVAHAVVTFPVKQRNVLLTDLANRMHFETQPTALQTAFLKEGVHLLHYRQHLPSDPVARSRYASLLTHAYKRITTLFSEQKYCSVLQM